MQNKPSSALIGRTNDMPGISRPAVFTSGHVPVVLVEPVETREAELTAALKDSSNLLLDCRDAIIKGSETNPECRVESDPLSQIAENDAVIKRSESEAASHYDAMRQVVEAGWNVALNVLGGSDLPKEGVVQVDVKDIRHLLHALANADRSQPVPKGGSNHVQ